MISQLSNEHKVVIQLTCETETFLCSCYSPPTDHSPVDRLEETFQTLSNNQLKKLCLCTDSNAHSTAWYNSFTDRKGSELEAFLLNNNMLVCNLEGYGPTFENSSNGKSWIDITAIGASLQQNVTNWKILEQESLSFHKFIYFEINYQGYTSDKQQLFNFKLTNWSQFNEHLETQIHNNNFKIKWNMF